MRYIYFEPIEIGYVSLMEFDSELFDRNVIIFIQTPLRNDLLNLFGSKPSLHCTPVIIKMFSESLSYRTFALVVRYLICLVFLGN